MFHRWSGGIARCGPALLIRICQPQQCITRSGIADMTLLLTVVPPTGGQGETGCIMMGLPVVFDASILQSVQATCSLHAG